MILELVFFNSSSSNSSVTVIVVSNSGSSFLQQWYSGNSSNYGYSSNYGVNRSACEGWRSFQKVGSTAYSSSPFNDFLSI